MGACVSPSRTSWPCTRTSTTPIAAKPSASETPYGWKARASAGRVSASVASSSPPPTSASTSPAVPAARSTCAISPSPRGPTSGTYASAGSAASWSA
ncbi:Uncharacterised protein [Mycobacteroides abscessus]|nr:Uncharacterised protein [Mycobacteroides abscessus]